MVKNYKINTKIYEPKILDLEGNIDMALINTFYDSPVNIIQQARDQMETTIKDGVLKVASKFIVDVDEQKLQQVLLHDKKRYSEAYQAGYLAGYNAAIAAIDELKGDKEDE